jgi:endonuclease/exonuclease/phosphatase family metal-dependent hydrolase
MLEKNYNHLRCLSFNIHKGKSALGIKNILNSAKQMFIDLDLDVILMQEVQASKNQLEILQDQRWPYLAYGKNAHYEKGHHGNAILSRFPLSCIENINLSQYQMEQRGLLKCTLTWSHQGYQKDFLIDLFCTHLDLTVWTRHRQYEILKRELREQTFKSHQIFAGDFNDWLGRDLSFMHALGWQEIFLTKFGRLQPTFPALLPFLSLDRFYHKGFQIEYAEIISGRRWGRLSDHASLLVDLSIGKKE